MIEANQTNEIAWMRVLFSLSKKFQEQIEKDKDKEMDEKDAEMPGWTGRTSLTQNYTKLHNSLHFQIIFYTYLNKKK